MQVNFPHWFPLLSIFVVWTKTSNGQDMDEHGQSPHANIQLGAQPQFHIGGSLMDQNPHTNQQLHPHKNHIPLKTAHNGNHSHQMLSHPTAGSQVDRKRKIVTKKFSSKKSKKYSGILLEFCAADYRQKADEYHQIWLAHRAESGEENHEDVHTGKDSVHPQGNPPKTVSQDETSGHPASSKDSIANTQLNQKNNMLTPNVSLKAEAQIKNDAILGVNNVLKGSLQAGTDENGTVYMHGNHSITVVDGNTTGANYTNASKTNPIHDVLGNNITPGVNTQNISNNIQNLPKDINGVINSASPTLQGLNNSLNMSQYTNNNQNELLDKTSPGERKDVINSEVKSLNPSDLNPEIQATPLQELSQNVFSEKHLGNNSIDTTKTQSALNKASQLPQQLPVLTTSTTGKPTTTLGYLETAVMVFALNDTSEENPNDSEHQNNNDQHNDSNHASENNVEKEIEHTNNQSSLADSNEQNHPSDNGEKEGTPEPPERNNTHLASETPEENNETPKENDESPLENTKSADGQPEPQAAEGNTIASQEKAESSEAQSEPLSAAENDTNHQENAENTDTKPESQAAAGNATSAQENTDSSETQPQPKAAEENTAIEGNTETPENQSEPQPAEGKTTNPEPSPENRDILNKVSEVNGTQDKVQDNFPNAGSTQSPDGENQAQDNQTLSSEAVVDNNNPQNETGNPEPQPEPQTNQANNGSSNDTNTEVDGTSSNAVQNANPEPNIGETTPVGDSTDSSNRVGQVEDYNPQRNEGDNGTQLANEQSGQDNSTATYDQASPQNFQSPPESQSEPSITGDSGNTTAEVQPQDNGEAQNGTLDTSQEVQPNDGSQSESSTNETPPSEDGNAKLLAADSNEKAQDNSTIENGSTPEVQPDDQSATYNTDNVQPTDETSTQAEEAKPEPEPISGNNTSQENTEQSLRKVGDIPSGNSSTVQSTLPPATGEETDYKKQTSANESDNHYASIQNSRKPNGTDESQNHKNPEAIVPLCISTSTQKFELIKLVPYSSTPALVETASAVENVENFAQKPRSDQYAINQPDVTENKQANNDGHPKNESVPNNAENTTLCFTTKQAPPVAILQPLKQPSKGDLNTSLGAALQNTSIIPQPEHFGAKESSHKPEIEIEAETKADAEPKTETEPKPQAEHKPEAETKPTAELKPDNEPKSESEPKPKAEPKSEAEPKPKPEPKSETEAKPSAELKPEAEPKPETEPKPAGKDTVTNLNNALQPVADKLETSSTSVETTFSTTEAEVEERVEKQEIAPARIPEKEPIAANPIPEIQPVPSGDKINPPAQPAITPATVQPVGLDESDVPPQEPTSQSAVEAIEPVLNGGQNNASVQQTLKISPAGANPQQKAQFNGQSQYNSRYKWSPSHSGDWNLFGQNKQPAQPNNGQYNLFGNLFITQTTTTTTTTTTSKPRPSPVQMRNAPNHKWGWFS